MDRICGSNYVPTIQDILHIRKPTLGVQEHVFTLNEHIYRVIDVAGQKSHRKKWIHLFDCVTAVLFFASLSSFAEKMDEDPDTNSLQDSLQLFEEVVSNTFLTKSGFVLFLNKRDLVEKTLIKHKLVSCFPNYKGANDTDSCIKFIRDEFLKLKGDSQREVYVQVSCAIDVDLMNKIARQVMEYILEINLRNIKSF